MLTDDHALMREGLRIILQSHDYFSVIGDASNGNDAIVKSGILRPDVVIMDISMPGMNGIEACHRICTQFKNTKIIILSMHNTKEYVYRAIQAGAWGYLLKDSVGSEVVEAVRSVMCGHRFFGKGVEQHHSFSTLESLASHPKSPLDSLSARELEVLQLVVEGKTSAEIASDLLLSSKSVDTYRSRLMTKLGINNIASLVKFALQHGITPES